MRNLRKEIMLYLDTILSLFIKACLAAIIGVITYAYVKTLKQAGWTIQNVWTNLHFFA